MQMIHVERLIKNAYLYATFSDLPTQRGAIIASDGIIFGSGWNQLISGQHVSEIEMALITCQHSVQDATLVSPLPPSLRLAALIAGSGISQVIHHKAMKDLLDNKQFLSMVKGQELLRENDIEITEYDGVLGCFTLNYDGRCFTP